ncbi:MAG: 1-deoxy-D-xylulose-5-phosphate synthase [Candidatus Omnitrophota bacterium]
MMLLEKINSPQDLKSLDVEKLTILASEIRERIVDVVSKTGGHLASSLGAVELIIALHRCLDLPRDKIIFDVGHQTYAHKILTGRNKDFSSLRQYKGISGFPCKDESVYDTFTTGHSSNAVSLSLGLACARGYLAKKEHFKIVTVIGDGSLSGGPCFEGLNNAGHLKKDILVILNTNELSIAPNVGALSTYLNKIISLPIYNRFKNSLEGFFKSRVPKGSRLIRIANRFEEGLKGLFIPGMFFEELGFRYFGPLDGHDLPTLLGALKNILNIQGPKLLHVVTKKGRGYAPAENEPVRFHGTGPFDVLTGKAQVNSALRTYTQVFSKKIVELAKKDKRVVAITAAMPEGTGLDKFRDQYPQRFFDVGIAEGHAVSFSAGLAKAGLKPVVAIYSTFLQRAYDQIIEDIALQNLSVVFAVDRAGIVGEDGFTHQGSHDISYLKNIPNLVVMAPRDGAELEAMLEFAINIDKPVSIRYPKAFDPRSLILYPSKKSSVQHPASSIQLGKAEVMKKGRDFTLIGLGSMVAPSYEAIEALEKEGLLGTLVNARFIKPLDIDLIKEATDKTDFIFSVEEGIVDGGFGSAICEQIDKPVVRIGLPCEFIVHGKRDLLLGDYGLTAAGIAQRIRETVKKNG